MSHPTKSSVPMIVGERRKSAQKVEELKKEHDPLEEISTQNGPRKMN